MSKLITADWLKGNGWEPMYPSRSEMFWHHRSVPFVLIRLCEVYPQLRIGSSSVGWHIVTDNAKEQDVIDLVASMKIKLEAAAPMTESNEVKSE